MSSSISHQPGRFPSLSSVLVRPGCAGAAFVVPLVEGLGLVKSLVALQPDEPAPRKLAVDLASSVLPVPAGPFDEDGLGEPVGEVHDRRARPSSARYPDRAQALATSSSEVKRGRACRRRLSRADLPCLDDVLDTGQLAKAHRAPGVQLLGRDADLGPEAELTAIDEAGRRVDQHGGGIDLADKASRCLEVAGDDRLGVSRAEPGDVAIAPSRSSTTPTAIFNARNSVAKSSRSPSAIPGRAPGTLVTQRARHPRAPGSSGKELVGDVCVHEQRLHRVAHARPLHLGIDDDPLGHVKIRGGVDIDVAVPVAVEHVGNRRVLEDHCHSAGPPRGMRQSMSPRSRTNSTAVSCAVSSTSTTASAGSPTLEIHWRSAEAMTRLDSDAPADPRNKAALPDFKHNAAGVGCDVRAILVDDPHDTERDPDALDSKAVRAHVALHDLTDGVGQGRNSPQPFGHGGHASLREPETVHDRGRHPGADRAGEVGRVRAQDLVGAVDKALGGQGERLVLGKRRDRRQHTGGRAGVPGEIGQGNGRHCPRLAGRETFLFGPEPLEEPSHLPGLLGVADFRAT